MACGARLRIEVVYAEPGRARCRSFDLPAPACVADALAAAAADPLFAGLALGSAAVGLFGRRVGREHALSEGDRVEIYRPLPVDPKTARRARAAEARRRSARR